MQFATLAQIKDDMVMFFVLGKRVNAVMNESSNFNIEALSTKFPSNRGDILPVHLCKIERDRRSKIMNHYFNLRFV